MGKAFDPVACFKAYHAALEAQDLKAVSAFFAENAVYVSAGLGTVSGREKIIDSMVRYFKEYPDQKSWDEKIDALSPTTIKSVWRLVATSKTSGKPIDRRGLETVEFDKDGLINRIMVEDQTP